MMRAFLAAILDTILPGEPDLPGRLPPGSALAEITLVAEHPVVLAIAAAAGGGAAFVAADPEQRARLLREIERADPVAFRAFIAAPITAYYESPVVLHAMGWRAQPPQPAGHDLEGQDPETAARLARVAARAPFWRRAP